MPAPSLTPDDFRRVREVFEAALDHPPTHRKAFIARECAGDPRLISEVELMLTGDRQRYVLLDGDERETTEGSPLKGPQRCSSCHAVRDDADRFCRACGISTASGTPGDGGRFHTGTLFAKRFRIVAVLGRGGMGEVYRAFDLELGQPVALKFLTALRSDERARARLRSEVRLARQISHPNVCRVYDIGEADGELFLSMEYVDGEDLASLLKRIGRLPIDKGVDIARKVCAGLASAHAKGVIHRDLKPSNVMIDGRGEVRIMDFGLAAFTAELESPDVRSGTPAYMAPEQLAGREVTRQSDLYALGLVMYELFTGRAPFIGKDAGDLLRQRESHPATTPSTLIPDLGPRVERIILRCLEPDPKLRPASALDVAAALPGGDPLAEALAAGETPSPEIVAASGHVGSVSPAIGLLFLAAITVGVAAIAWMSQRTAITSYVRLDRSPERLAEWARTIAADLGYSSLSGDSAYGYAVNTDAVRHVRDNDSSPARWEALRNDRQTVLTFWYRQSPQPLSPLGMSTSTLGRVTRTDPPENVPGMVSIEIDTGGRLTQLTAVPPRTVRDDRASPPDWPQLFRHAGLDFSRFTPTSPRRVPPVFADQQGAWDGILPDTRNTPVRVEAAAYAGSPVSFEIITPSREGTSAVASRSATTNSPLLLYAAIFVLSLLLVRHNLRLGRADRRGAFRTAALMAVATLAGRLLVTDDTSELVPFVGSGLALALWAAVVPWTFYIALEPYVRRVWPEMLIGWSRLISGRVRDPLIGRDVLVGIVGGIAVAALVHLRVLVPGWLGFPPPSPLGSEGSRAAYLLAVANGPGAIVALPLSLTNSLFIGLLSAITLVLLTMLLRGRGRAAVAWVVIWTVANQVPSPGDPIADLAYKALTFSIAIVLLIRFGLLTSVVHLITTSLLVAIELRFDAVAPHSAAAYMLIGAIAVLALYGFHTALAGQSVFGTVLLKEDST